MMRYDRFNSNKYKLKWRKIQSGLLSWPMYIYIYNLDYWWYYMAYIYIYMYIYI